MAQRFAIDGNFTQSFVGTVQLNASACPSNVDDFASLYYDLDTGTVCYVTASTDFCYEFLFDAERIIAVDRDSNARQAQPPAQSFQFVGGGGAPGDLSEPKTNLNATDFLMFDSESFNAGNLFSYLIQNTSSGSIKLTTRTEAVQIDYSAQSQTGSFGNNIVIIGQLNNVPTGSNPNFTVLTKTSATPFIQGERVCVEVIKAGGAGTSTTYQTGSDIVQTDLNNLKIVDYDSNVFVTSDPITGELTLQFGSPALPSITSFTVPETGNQGSDAFNTNRFSGPGSGLFVVDNDYKMILQYETASTNTFLSASVLGVRNGVYETLATSTNTSGDITFTISDFSAADQAYFESGSHEFKGAVHVRLEDGSDFTTQSAAANPTLDKGNPGLPQYGVTFDTLANNAYVSNTGGGNQGVTIEIGATGSVDYHGIYGSGDNGWTRTSISPDPASPSTLSITTTSTTNFNTITANYSSNGLGTPTTKARTANKSVSRIVSLRYGALPAGTFANYLSPTNDELLDLLHWTNNGGVVVFQTNTNDEINGYGFDITWTGDKYHYIIMDDSISLSQINIDGFGSITAFTTGTTSNYRFYVTTGNQAGGTGTTAAYGLIT